VPELLHAQDPPTDAGTQNMLVRQALGELRSQFQTQTWQAFWRTAIDDRPAAAVDEELGMTPDAFRHAKHRVLLKLREFLGPD
jgi:RNA polymerase sigma-70 factor (ECF subfamily)